MSLGGKITENPFLPKPPTDPKLLLDWSNDLIKELRIIIANLSEQVNYFIDGRFLERTSAPINPDNGMIAYADGVSWNPGSGKGFYEYRSGAWYKL